MTSPAPAQWDTQAVVSDLARWLGSMGLGLWSSASYPKFSNETVIYGEFSENAHDRALVLIRYGVDDGDHPEDRNTQSWSIQIISRVRKQDTRWMAHALADRVYDALQDRESVTLPGGTSILEVHRVIAGEIDRDEAGRFFRADSYVFLLNREVPK